MKRVFTLFLVLLYAVASIGATATTHLCAGKEKKNANVESLLKRTYAVLKKQCI